MMRFAIVAALALSLSGAAWAGGRPDSLACEIHEEGFVDAAEINRIVHEAIDEALAALRESERDALIDRTVDAEVDAALADVDRELASLDVSTAYAPEVDHDVIDARVAAAMERMEAALERAEERLEEAQGGEFVREPKTWRPRY